MFNTRVRIPETARAGEVVTIRTMIIHPMDNGLSVMTNGELIPLDIITDFTCHYLGEEVFRVALEPSFSANPAITFPLRITRSGPVRLEWTHMHTDKTVHEAMITVAG